MTKFKEESKSIEGLIRKIEELFDCRDGPYRAWVEHEGERVDYVSLGILREGYKTSYLETDPEMLRNALLCNLIMIRTDLLERKFGKSLVASLGQDRRLPLYWRYHESQRIQEESESRGDGKILSKIFTRVAIPGANWELIDIARYPVRSNEEPYPRI